MIFKNNIFAVYLDEHFIGICETKDYIWNLAQNHTNGTPYPLTDDNFCDRVQYNSVNINRYDVYGKNAYDKITDESFLCANNIIAKELTDKLNELYLKVERTEAKERAMAL